MAKDTSKVDSLDDLQKRLKAKRDDLLQARRSNAAGELVNPRVLRSYRKDIARLLTQIKEKEQING